GIAKGIREINLCAMTQQRLYRFRHARNRRMMQQRHLFQITAVGIVSSQQILFHRVGIAIGGVLKNLVLAKQRLCEALWYCNKQQYNGNPAEPHCVPRVVFYGSFSTIMRLNPNQIFDKSAKNTDNSGKRAYIYVAVRRKFSKCGVHLPEPGCRGNQESEVCFINSRNFRNWRFPLSEWRHRIIPIFCAARSIRHRKRLPPRPSRPASISLWKRRNTTENRRSG